jgi:hypothetical protein
LESHLEASLPKTGSDDPHLSWKAEAHGLRNEMTANEYYDVDGCFKPFISITSLLLVS